jgi:FkbM family methyltransferase
MKFLKPNYVFLDRFTPSSVIIDVGCGYDAEFSRHLIEAYGLHAYGVDPTRKHAPALKALADASHGKFQHWPLAVSQEVGRLTFQESRNRESGSLLPEHTNLREDVSIAYEVESVTLGELVQRIGSKSIALAKLDLEGAEYELLKKAAPQDFAAFDQLFIEFHHHCTRYTIQDTQDIILKLKGMGFVAFTLDHHNYLFYKPRP